MAAVTLPSITLFSAMTAVRNNLATLKRENSLAAVAASLFPLDDYFELTGLKELLARQEGYEAAARSLAAKTARKKTA